jgi:hypothetical protein
MRRCSYVCTPQSCLVALFYGSLAIVFTPDPTLGTALQPSHPAHFQICSNLEYSVCQQRTVDKGLVQCTWRRAACACRTLLFCAAGARVMASAAFLGAGWIGVVLAGAAVRAVL